MTQTPLAKSTNRGQRHSAAWGKRISRLLLPLLLLAQSGFTPSGFAQEPAVEGRMIGKFAADLAPALSRAQQGAKASDTVKVIVQYKQAPRAEHEARDSAR